MSKAIRIKDHLYAEIERLAKEEKRSMIGQLELLLEQALRLTEQPTQANQVPMRITTTASPPSYFPDREVKSDFK